jgi:M6 family metalloprotease-like protein
MAVFMLFAAAVTAHALTPPREGELTHYKNDGSLENRKRKADFLGNHRFSPALIESVKRNEARRANPDRSTPESFAPPPAWQGGLPATGSPKVLVLLIDFPDYPASPTDTVADVASKYFGSGVPSQFPYESLKNFYTRSSYGALNITGNVLGWYRAKNNRSYYENNFQFVSNGESYPYGNEELIKEALAHFNSQGHDFTQYDNSGTGRIDALFVKWTGPDNGWSNFWWAYQSNFWYNNTYTIDGKKIGKYVWSWIKNSDWGDTEYQPLVDIHETGHMLGLPDYYDYDDKVGPAGGIGKIDMMDGNWGDHNAFSKSMLGWMDPTTIASGERTLSLAPSGTTPDAVKVMPGATASHFGEYFLFQYRKRGTGNDATNYPTDGLIVWHVNAALNAGGQDFQNNNSSTARKLLRLVQADGLQQIETTNLPDGAWADAGDFFVAPKTFGPATAPNSNAYSGAVTGVGMDNLSTAGATLNARFGIGLGSGALYALTVSRSGTGGGTVTSSPAGISCGSDCAESYAAGTNVVLTATPDAGSSFAGWSGACTGAAAQCTVTMGSAQNVAASFTAVAATRLVMLTKTGSGTGGVTSSPAGLSCAGGCPSALVSFASNTAVTLVAQADSGSTFAGWSGACTGTGACTIAAGTGTANITASFNASGGSGTVTALLLTNVSGATGSLQTYSVAVPAGATNLKIQTSGGTGDADLYIRFGQAPTTSVFDCASLLYGNNETCEVPFPNTGAYYHILLEAYTAFSGLTLTATYQPGATQNHALTVTRQGTGSGTVTSTPAGIHCGATCTASYAAGTPVTLTAQAAAGSTFNGWSGACTGTAGTCTVSMSAARSVTASFNSTTTRPFTLNKAGSGTGSVTITPPGVTCDATCTRSWPVISNNVVVTLVAQASAGSSFAGWSGACTGTGTCTIAAGTSAVDVTASFNTGAPATRTVTLGKAGNGSGAVTSSPAGLSCAASCSSATASFASTTAVTLVAQAASGSTFAGWMGACTGTGTCTIAAGSSNANVTASFNSTTTRPFTLNKAGSGTGSVTITPPGVTCDATCTRSWPVISNNVVVTLVAQASAGSSFAGWSGACTGTGTCTIAAGTSAVDVTASFNTSSVTGPLADPVDFVTQQYMDFLRRAPDSAGLNFWVTKLNAGTTTRAQVIESMMYSNEFRGRFGPLVRLYTAYFQRVPDYAGLMYWFDRMYPNSGAATSLSQVSDAFAQSGEFVNTYGPLDNAGFITRVYQNVLGRTPDAAGYTYWLGQLNAGTPRGQVMTAFSESAENQNATANSLLITMGYVGMLRRSPDAVGYAWWLAEVNAGRTSVLSLITGFLNSPEYAARF